MVGPVVSGETLAGKTALLARIAVETARGGGPVLWISTDRACETPVLRFLTGIARVPTRNLFVHRQLQDEQWQALAAAADELRSLPIELVDAHGVTSTQVTDLVRAGRSRLALVAIDPLPDVSGSLLLGLEALADEVDVPFIATARMPTPLAFPDDMRGSLRRGSLVLHLADCAGRFPDVQDARSVRVDVHRVGDATVTHSLRLSLLGAHRWFEPYTEAS